MSGISFKTDKKGKQTAVTIDLKKHRRLWEDFYDSFLIEQRRNEPRIDWETAKKMLNKKRAK